MQQREALIERVIGAGTFLQEHFVSRLSVLLGCSNDAAHQRLQQRIASMRAAGGGAAAAAADAAGDSGDLKVAAVAAAAAAFESGDGEGGLQRRKHALLQMAAAAAGPSGADAATSTTDAAAAAAVMAEKLSLTRLADAATELLSLRENTAQQPGFKKEQTEEEAINPWLLLRQNQLPLAAAGVRPTAASAAQQLRQLLRTLQRMQDLPEQRRQLLLLLSTSPMLQQQLPRVAKLLQTQRLLPLYMQPVRPRSISNISSSKDVESRSTGSSHGLTHPPPNVVVRLKSGIPREQQELFHSLLVVHRD